MSGVEILSFIFAVNQSLNQPLVIEHLICALLITIM